MRLLPNLPLATLVLLGCAAAAHGADEPQWIRYPAISPDGGRIAFSYRGQIFTVPAAGGAARAVTSQGHYSYAPVWSPDSAEIAFASDINGDDDVFVTDGSGKRVHRLTWTSRREVPTGFSPDGDTVLFTSRGLGDPVATVQTPLNGSPHLYQVDTDGSDRKLVLPNQARHATWSPDGASLLYSYDPSLDPASRQHRVASNARQVWLYDRVSGKHRRLFESAHDATDPAWGPDGNSVYYLGEQSGTLNVWVHDLRTDSSRQLTFHEAFPARHLSVARDGTVAYVHAGRLHLLAPGANQPREIEVAFSEAQMDQPTRRRGFETSEFVTSPDGAYVAVVSAAEIVLIDRQGNTRQLTDTPAPEKDVAFSPDSGLLAYAAQRDGVWGIYGVNLQREEAETGLALTYEEHPLVVGEENAFQPQFSPDGSKLAYVHARREVRVLDLVTGETYAPFGPGDYNTSYGDGDIWFNWSPDSRSIVSSWKSVPFAVVSKAAIMPADASGPLRPITTSMPDIGEAVFSGDGTQIIAQTRHFGLRTIDENEVVSDFYRIFVSDEARADFLDEADGRTLWTNEEDDDDDDTGRGYAFQPERKTYLEGRLTAQSAHHFAFKPLADSPYMLSVAADIGLNSVSVLSIDLRDGQMTEIAGIGDIEAEAFSIAPQARILDIKTADGIVTVPIDAPDQRRFLPVSIEQDLDGAARRRAAFDQIWADIRFKYYRSDVEGRDWDRIGAHYRGYLDSIASDRELADLVDEMFGEISASHLFVSYQPDAASRRPGTATASLGVYLDPDHEGPGVGVAQILDGGPLDRDSFGIGPGSVITSVDGRPLPEAGGLERALDGKAGRPLQIGIMRPGETGETLIGVRPITLAEEGALAYQRWVDTRRAHVDERSRRCIAYQHVAAMFNADYVDAYGRLMSARDTARAAIVDVRSNTGGNLHRQLLNLLDGEPYAQVGREERQRDVEPLNRWNGPSAVVIDSFSYSDGSIFPQAYQDIGLGPLVGERLLNTGTGVNYIQSALAPGLSYGIPVQPFRRLDGTYYENLEIEPDILVPHDPNALAAGRDPQLDAAIDALMDKIGKDADCR
jgi:tricorn protease